MCNRFVLVEKEIWEGQWKKYEWRRITPCLLLPVGESCECERRSPLPRGSWLQAAAPSSWRSRGAVLCVWRNRGGRGGWSGEIVFSGGAPAVVSAAQNGAGERTHCLPSYVTSPPLWPSKWLLQSYSGRDQKGTENKVRWPSLSLSLLPSCVPLAAFFCHHFCHQLIYPKPCRHPSHFHHLSCWRLTAIN